MGQRTSFASLPIKRIKKTTTQSSESTVLPFGIKVPKNRKLGNISIFMKFNHFIKSRQKEVVSLLDLAAFMKFSVSIKIAEISVCFILVFYGIP